MTRTSSITQIDAQDGFERHYVANAGVQRETGSMAKSKKVSTRFKTIPQWRRNFVKQWRKYRGLTQEELAERAEMNVGNISKLEQGQQGYSDQGLHKIAEALNCSPGQLLMVDPTKDGAMWSIWEQASPGDRLKIVDTASIITGIQVPKTGTDDR